MADTYLTFQKFNDAGLAQQIAERLKQNGINYLIENNQKFFDPSFANNTIDPDIIIKLRSEDFVKAHKALDEYYQKHLENVEEDYYLFTFTNDELREIITKPDEWGHFDYQLANKILRDRGKEIPAEEAAFLKTQRIKKLAQPEKEGSYWIYVGYFSAIFGGLFGIFIGWALAYLKKTLPNGERVFAYNENERKHGMTMLFISIFSLMFWIIFRTGMLSS